MGGKIKRRAKAVHPGQNQPQQHRQNWPCRSPKSNLRWRRGHQNWPRQCCGHPTTSKPQPPKPTWVMLWPTPWRWRGHQNWPCQIVIVIVASVVVIIAAAVTAVVVLVIVLGSQWRFCLQTSIKELPTSKITIVATQRMQQHAHHSIIGQHLWLFGRT